MSEPVIIIIGNPPPPPTNAAEYKASIISQVSEALDKAIPDDIPAKN